MTGGATGSHARWEQLAAGSALHALQPEEEAELQRHRATCLQCQETGLELADVAAVLALAVEPVEPPPRLRAAVLAAAAADAPEPAQPEPATGSPPTPLTAQTASPVDQGTPTPLAAVPGRHRSRPRAERWQRWTMPAAAAVLAVALAGGVFWWFRGHADQESGLAAVGQCQQDPGCRALALTAPDGRRGTALVRGQSVVLVVDGLGRNDPDRDSYVLWQLQRTGAVSAVGSFDVAQPVTTTSSLPLRDAAQAAGLAITLEPGRVAPASPSGPILATATL